MRRLSIVLECLLFTVLCVFADDSSPQCGYVKYTIDAPVVNVISVITPGTTAAHIVQAYTISPLSGYACQPLLFTVNADMVPNPVQVSSSVPAELDDVATSDTLNQFLFTGALTWTRVTLNVISTTVSIEYGITAAGGFATYTEALISLLRTPSGQIQGAIQTAIPNGNSTTSAAVALTTSTLTTSTLAAAPTSGPSQSTASISKSGSTGLSHGAVIGIAVSISAVVVLLALLLLHRTIRSKKSTSTPSSTSKKPFFAFFFSKHPGRGYPERNAGRAYELSSSTSYEASKLPPKDPVYAAPKEVYEVPKEAGYDGPGTGYEAREGAYEVPRESPRVPLKTGPGQYDPYGTGFQTI